jgi:hypothetical protein
LIDGICLLVSLACCSPPHELRPGFAGISIFKALTNIQMFLEMAKRIGYAFIELTGKNP